VEEMGETGNLNKLSEMICLFVEENGQKDVESVCVFLDRLAMLMSSYRTVVEYASSVRVGNDIDEEWEATKRAMRLAMSCAIKRVNNGS
jgi:hypothetical protein